MSKTAADILIDGLIAWGVNTVFGLPGDGINGIMEALRKKQDKIRFIQVRHEEAAALAACGYAKWTGKLGVCLATSGPGGIHLLNGLYDAKMDGAPVLAITGLQFHDLVGTFTQQDVELDKLFMDVCVYNARIMGAAHVENVTELACRTALAWRGVSHLTIATDMQSLPVDDDTPSQRNLKHHVSNVMADAAPKPPEHQLQEAAGILNEGKKVCILAGRGAIGAGAELEAVAEKLKAPIAKALLGKAAVSDLSPYSTGGVGLLGTAPSQNALAGCDTLLIVGSSFPYIEFYPKPGQARAVQIDFNPQRIGLRYPVDYGLVGDARQVLAGLLPHLKPNKNTAFLDSAQSDVRDWRKLLTELAERDDKPMKPQVVAHELNKLIPDNALVTTDSGTNTSWAARYLDIHDAMQFTVSGTLATMACGLPYAIAAAVAFPKRPVIALVGDGGLTMLMGELATAVKYKLDIKIVIIKNNSLGQIKWEQMGFLGNPEYQCDLQPIDFAGVARACGAAGFAIDDPKQCAATLREALATPGPVVVEATVDPNEPPLPPKTTFEFGKNFAEALARGTKSAGKIMGNVAREKVRELI
jgi:pyruvate dehydrogenase (quinone)/pyruvate oxidase